MDEIRRGQVVSSAAEVYDRFFLPALFEEWPPFVVSSARLKTGWRVLDVACGTGALTLAAARAVGPRGEVVGLDINSGMLDVARKKSVTIDWRSAPAESLPFPDDNFDAVISQFGLMFFDNRHKAIDEMVRVLKPGGRLAVAVWDTLENTPGYAIVTDMLQRLFGDQAADALRTPYNLGEADLLRELFNHAGLENVTISTHTGTARFPSIEAWMYTDVQGWTLADVLDDAQFDRLQVEAQRELARFVIEDGSIAFSAPAHIVTARKR